MTDFSASPSTVVRQRIFNGHPVDVEKVGESRPNGNHTTSVLNTGTTTIRQLEELEAGLTRFVNRFTRKGKKNVPVVATLRAIAFSSSWVAHFVTKKNESGEEVKVFRDSVTFTCQYNE
ncbi:hypothetical protein C0992_004278 [Termitomyces sp. T32_za158]|nr:hypothetical protein C0992_004278 [Termitomyces sp. T32_za158]